MSSPSSSEEEEQRTTLYRLEFFAPEDEHWVDWDFDSDQERFFDAEDNVRCEIRIATDDELSAYNAGADEASMIAEAKSKMESYNGVAYRMDKFEVTDDGVDLETTKVFTCGKCNEVRDFESVATFGDMYLSYLKDEESSVLWYICKGCSIA